MPEANVHVVTGRVVVRETHAAVSDLVVVLFDADPGWRVGADTRLATRTAAASAAPRAQRLGSVATAPDGSFRLEFTSSVFDPEPGDDVPRPDLVLVVLAPDDGAAAGVDPDALGGRVLVQSEAIRHQAARHEAYVLRVPQAALVEYGIPVPVGGIPESLTSQASSLVQAVAEQVGGERALREGLREQRADRMVRHREALDRAAAATRYLRMASPRVRDTATFISEPSELRHTQLAIMSEDVHRLGTGVMHGHTVVPFDSEAWTIREVDGGAEVDPEVMCEAFASMRGGPAVERVISLVEQRRQAEHDAARIDAATEETESETPGDGEGPPAEDGDVEELVSRAVAAQLSDMVVSDPPEASSVNELMERVTGFKLPAGPADTTAIHDFHELQVAFRHVWTEAFDGEFADTVRDLYAAVVEMHEDYGIDAELPAELAEVRQLEEFLRKVEQDAAGIDDIAPPEVDAALPDAAAEWHTFSPGQQVKLLQIARELTRTSPQSRQQVVEHSEPGVAGTTGGGFLEESPEETRRREFLRAEAERITDEPRGTAGRALRLVEEIHERLRDHYAFHYFAPDSVNFGILVTYRQQWQPLAYQVGDLQSTITLAPGESRKITSKTTVTVNRAQKELERSLSVRKGESTEHRRAEAEIAEKASATTNFSTSASGSLTLGLGSISSTTEFALNQAQESARMKKAVREATVKAAEEYRRERSVEVSTSDVLTDEHTTSGEISNPNNEVTVTYLLYELERQYQVTGRVQRVTPVILVAQDVPSPEEITESWLLAYEWVLRKVALTDLVHDALDELTSLVGDEVGLAVLRAGWEEQRRLVHSLQADVETHRNARDRLREQLVATERERELTEIGGSSTGQDVAAAIFSGGLSLFGPDRAEQEAERLEVERKAIEMELEYRESTLQELEGRLSRASDAFATAQREFEAGLRDQSARRARIDQCRMHCKQNILYYMQAIWNHEPPDQRFFRLYDVDVTLPQPAGPCRLRPAEPDELDGPLPTIKRDGDWWVLEHCPPPAPFDPDDPDLPVKKLVEVADVDRLLGFKGNYAIFPVKTCVYLTEFMLRDFVDGYFGLRDPDPAGDFTTDELIRYIESLWRDPNVELADDERDALLELVRERLREPRNDTDVVVVPTGQLYMDALVGTHPLLEPFKLIHRGVDAAQARAELRREELDNLRRAARLLADEPLLDDPDIDRRIVVDGVTPVVDPG